MDIIGIFGGTFNPIHNGHLALAHTVLARLHCQQIRFITAALPPHKTAPAVTAAQRAAMVSLAIADQPAFVLDDCELDRPGTSFTMDTLLTLRQRFPAKSLMLMIGQDSYVKLPTWHRWRELLDVAHLLVIHRAHSATHLDLHAEHHGKAVKLEYAGQRFAETSHGSLSYLTVTPPDISSTRVRAQLMTGDASVCNDIPPSVWQYIQQHQLYAT